MEYIEGRIVWYRKLQDDPDITYQGNDPIAATVTTVRAPDRADLTIMVDNHTPVLRENVPLIQASGTRPGGHFAAKDRDWAVDPELAE